MKVVRKLRIQFVAVFMALMLASSAAICAFIYFRERSELEYQCMVLLLDIHNQGNKETPSPEPLAAYPPFFVLEIDNMTNSARVVEGRFFLADRGVTTDELISHLVGHMEESGVLKEYQVRYFNGIRAAREHRISFIDVSYIDAALRGLLGKMTLIVIPMLVILFFAAYGLSLWFSSPAKQAMEDQSRFISKISHELKTPVSVIRANVDLIDGEHGKGDPGDLLFGCENIRYECQRMTNLIDAMLLAALPARSVESDWETLDLTKLLQKEMLRFEVVAFDHGLDLSLETEEGLTLRGDEIQVTRLIDIFVENAIKYCTPGGDILVTAARRLGPGRRVRIVCANDGEELTREQRENIFKPFYQADSTQKGAGLGLSIAAEIVTAMRGSIQLEYAEGKNRFIIDL